MRRALPILVLLSAAGTAACSDSNAPAIQARSYRLVSYGGAPLPVILRRVSETSTNPGGPTTNCDDKLTASKLELLATKRFTQTDSHLLVCDDGRADATSQTVLQGSYTTGADTVVMDADLGSGTHYVSFGRFGSSGLTIHRREARMAGGATSTDPTSLIFTNAPN